MDIEKRKTLKIKAAWRTESVFHYIITFSMVMVLIFAAMGGYLYRYYCETIYNDFVAANQSEVENIVSGHEKEMQIINNIVLQMSLETDIIRFLLNEEPVKSLKLIDRLYQYKIATQFFDSVFYCYHEDHYLYNQTTSFDIDFLLEQGIGLEESQREVLKRYLYEKDGGLKVMPEQNAFGYLQEKYPVSRKTVIYIMPVIPYNMGTMAFTVNEFYYDRLLGSTPSEQKIDCILYDGQIIVSRGFLDLENQQIINWVGEGKDGTKRVEAGGEKYLLTCGVGENGFIYCQIQSMDLFQEKVLSGQWSIFLPMLSGGVILSFIIIRVSRLVSAKVKKLNVLLNQDEDDYYSLGSIESGIALLTQNSSQNAQESEIYRKSDFLRGFVRSDYGEGELEAACVKAGFSLENSLFLVVLMGDRGNSNERKAYSLMLAEIQQDSCVEGYGIQLVSSGQSLFVLFGKVQESIERILQRMFVYGHKFCQDFIMAISDYHHNLLEGSKAYLEADTAYNNRFLIDNGEILKFSEVNISQKVKILPDTFLRSLKSAIWTGDEREVDRAVREICSRMKQENQSLLAFRILYNDLVHMLLTEFQDEGEKVRELYNVFTLSQCLNMQDFYDVLCEACKLLMTEKRGEDSDERGDTLPNRATRYMQENYHNPELNMGSLAEYLEISPVTLAVRFKNYTGISPSEYLAGIRMEKSKELLKNTNMLVKEISLAVGYEDERVYMRRFKKYTGETPKQYRAKQKE